MLAKVDNGGAGRDLVAAVFDGDAERAARLLAGDRRLRTTSGGDLADLLSIAIATCSKPMVGRLLAAGVPPDGPPGSYPPRMLALRATEPWFAETLLAAGASTERPPSHDIRPIDEAITLGSMAAVRLLLDRGARLEDADSLGYRPLQTALDAHRFAIAELLIARGAEPEGGAGPRRRGEMASRPRAALNATATNCPLRGWTSAMTKQRGWAMRDLSRETMVAILAVMLAACEPAKTPAAGEAAAGAPVVAEAAAPVPAAPLQTASAPVLARSIAANGKAEAQVVEATRANGVVTVNVRFMRTQGSSGAVTAFSAYQAKDGLYMVAADKKYFLLADTEGKPIGGTDVMLRLGEDTPVAGMWFGKFPAPPPEVRSVTLVLPDVAPFDNVALTDR